MSKKQETQKYYEEFGALTKEQIAKIDKTPYGRREDLCREWRNLKMKIFTSLENLLTKFIK